MHDVHVRVIGKHAVGGIICLDAVAFLRLNEGIVGDSVKDRHAGGQKQHAARGAAQVLLCGSTDGFDKLEESGLPGRALNLWRLTVP